MSARKKASWPTRRRVGMAAQEDTRHQRADHGEHAGLDERIGDDVQMSM